MTGLFAFCSWVSGVSFRNMLSKQFCALWYLLASLFALDCYVRRRILTWCRVLRRWIVVELVAQDQVENFETAGWKIEMVEILARSETFASQPAIGGISNPFLTSIGLHRTSVLCSRRGTSYTTGSTLCHVSTNKCTLTEHRTNCSHQFPY